jgi:hypothetical protein
MATATILYVGDDICHRIAVMERSGFTVLRSERSTSGVREAFAAVKAFSAITFHNVLDPPMLDVVSTTRALSAAPVVLFEDPFTKCDEHVLDLVVPAHTAPSAWLKSLQELIEQSRKLREISMQIREDSAATRAKTRSLRAMSARNRISPIASGSAWHGESGESPEDPKSDPLPPPKEQSGK